ncbi:hypothetical protein [uncultured Enterococcus sp.]|uniref:hypothetical protein n=1 Tax=uncultured Enterococcus sp. TaxID=167972 RepID=UPI002585A8E3|nr:hypothetical protein [uncultured Enterococcus sp.]
MEKKQLNRRQIFGMKKDSLEKRISEYYTSEQDSGYIIECLVAILVRNALVVADFSQIAYSLVRELFLSAEPNQTMQEYYAFFESYFVEEERNAIITRLYKSKNNYYKNFKTARRHSNLVNQPTLTKEQPDEREVVLKTIFEDANGKAVKWVLRDVDPSKDKKEFEPILKILTTLSIFQKDGVRQFVSLVDSKRVKSEIEILVEKKTSPKKGKKIAAKKKTTSTSTQKNPRPKAGSSSSLERNSQKSQNESPKAVAPNKVNGEKTAKRAKATIPEATQSTDVYLAPDDPTYANSKEQEKDAQKQVAPSRPSAPLQTTPPNKIAPVSIATHLENGLAEAETMPQRKEGKSNKKIRNLLKQFQQNRKR